MKSPEEMSDDELSEAVAVEVAGWWRGRGDQGEYPGYWYSERGVELLGMKPPKFATSFDAVLPLLEKWHWQAHRRTVKNVGSYFVDLDPSDYYSDKCGESHTFPRAAAIALLKARRAQS